jgi:hypothetical protein
MPGLAGQPQLTRGQEQGNGAGGGWELGGGFGDGEDDLFGPSYGDYLDGSVTVYAGTTAPSSNGASGGGGSSVPSDSTNPGSATTDPTNSPPGSSGGTGQAQSQSGADPCAAGGCLDPITVTAQRPSVWSSVWNFVTGLFASPSTPYRINGIPVNEGVFFPPLGAATEGVAAGGARFIVNSAGDALDTEAPLYRVFGDQSPATGQFWSTVDPAAVADYRTAAGLFPGNSGQFVAEGVLTDSSGVTFGTAAPGPGGVGGGLPEVIVPNAGGQICFLCVSGANPPF